MKRCGAEVRPISRPTRGDDSTDKSAGQEEGLPVRRIFSFCPYRTHATKLPGGGGRGSQDKPGIEVAEDTAFTSTPLSRAAAARAWRRSWNLRRSSPASFGLFSQRRTTALSGRKHIINHNQGGGLFHSAHARQRHVDGNGAKLFLHNMDSESAELAVQIDILNFALVGLGGRVHNEG